MNSELLYVFGTGNATVTNLYNTCFALRDGDEYFMVDAGGGNGILKILDNMQVPLEHIHHIFVTHAHTDHVLGIVWMVRMIATKMKKDQYVGDAYIYCHSELIETIRTLCRLTIQDKFYNMIGDRIHLIPVHDGDKRQILNYPVTFFDIHSTKARQFGFRLTLHDEQVLTCMGDEPFNELNLADVSGSDWLLSEAFCLYSEADKFKPYEKHHSTVREACELAQRLKVRHLVLWHTEETHLARRRELYTAEGRQYFSGDLHIPDDLDVIQLN